MNYYRKIFAVLILIFMGGILKAQEYEVQQIKEKLPQVMDANNVGTEFWLTIPPCYEETTGNNYIKIFITGPFKTEVVVEVPGKGFFRTKKTIPDNVIEFNISPALGQVYHREQQTPYKPEKVYNGAGIHVFADDPIVVYCVVRYRATSDGFLVLPVSSLGNKYISATYGDMGKMYDPGKYPSLVGIVSPFDDNTVTFELGGNDVTQTAGGLSPGQSANTIMNKGDVWMFSSSGYDADLTGSIISSDKPVAVVSGNYCANIPLDNRWCDYTVEMDLPTYTWGNYCIVPQVPDRTFPSVIRVFAKYKNTNIYRDGLLVGTIQTAGGVFGKGYMEMRLVPEEPRAAVYSGDKPISVTLYNNGVQEDQKAGENNTNGDPFVMAISPTSQYQKEISFCAPALYGGDSFINNYVFIVFETDGNDTIPDSLEYAEEKNGELNWVKVRDKFGSECQVLEYLVDNKQYAVKLIPIPRFGICKIRNASPVGAFSYGYDSYDSYGYPASAGQVDLEHNDIDIPKVEFMINPDGSVNNGSAKDMPDDDNLRSNLRSATFYSAESYNYKFTCDSIIPGQTREVNWSLERINPTAYAKAVITFMDRCGNDTTVIVNYSAGFLEISPYILDFGIVNHDRKTERSFNARNIGEKDIIIKSMELKDDNSEFNIVNTEIPDTVKAGDSLLVKVSFTGKEKSAKYSDTLIINYDDNNIVSIPVMAETGIAIIALNDFDFGNIGFGEFLTMPLPIINNGNAELKITGIKKLEDSESFTNNPNNISENNPITVNAGDTAWIKVTFKPESRGLVNETLKFESNADEGKDTMNIQGKGVAAEAQAGDIDFGKVELTKTITQKAIIRNEGDYVLKIKSFYKPEYKSFKVDESFTPSYADPILVEPGNSYELTVSYTAVAEGEFNDHISLTTNSMGGDERIDLYASTNSTGVTENPGDDVTINVYPNPVSTVLFIKSDILKTGRINYKIFDTNGNLLINSHAQWNGRGFEIPVSRLSNGAYLLNIEYSGKHIPVRFEVAR